MVNINLPLVLEDQLGLENLADQQLPKTRTKTIEHNNSMTTQTANLFASK